MNKLPLRPNVCMILINQDHKIWLGERAGESGHWQLPQGGVEEEMTPEENVYRELQEELGIERSKLTILKRLEITHSYFWDNPPDYARGVWGGQQQSFWLLKFIGEDSDFNLNLHKPEFQNWCWCSIDEVLSKAEPKRIKGYTAALAEIRGEIARKIY